jgi:hypothetical protein
MDIEMIPLSQLQTDPHSLLSECCDSGRPIVVDDFVGASAVACQEGEIVLGGSAHVTDLPRYTP